MKKRKILSMAWIGLGSALLLGIGVLGYWKQTGNTLNIITIGAFQNQIVEEYQIPVGVIPGDTIDKVVNVSNTGTVDSLIRVSVKKMFGETKEDGTFLPDHSLNPDKIQITYADTWWTKGKDDYFYYKDILRAGEMTKEPLFREYHLSEDAGNEYKGKEARIVVTMESMQADMDPQKIWGVSIRNNGLTTSGDHTSESTKVVYRGKNGGFQISESTTDLFASFKNLTPGCARVQEIHTENRSGDQVEILLRAESADQTFSSEEERRKIRKLLEKDAMIRVKEGGRELYYGPVSGNLSGGAQSMREDISLGVFPAHSTHTLTVTLEMNPDMEAEEGKLTGKVKWIFTAKGDDASTVVTTSSYPATGDHTNLPLWVALMISALIMIAAGLRLRRKAGSEE